MRELFGNPWGLTRAESGALSAIVVAGTEVMAAQALGLSPKTVNSLVSRAKDRMGVDSRLHALLEWDRFVRSSPVGNNRPVNSVFELGSRA